MWLKEPQKQKIIFIDPKGIARLSLTDDKLNLHKHLKEEIQPKIGKSDLELDAYIISVTPYETFCKAAKIHKTKEQLARENHLIFQEETQTRSNEKYLNTLFNQINSS